MPCRYIAAVLICVDVTNYCDLATGIVSILIVL